MKKSSIKKRKKFIQAGIASFLFAFGFLFLSFSYGSVTADSVTNAEKSIKSASNFSIIAYCFFAASIIFFFYSLFRKD